MPKITKRIPLSSLQLEDLTTIPGNPDPDNPQTPDNSLPSLLPAFTLTPQSTIETASVDFSFPAEDYKRVQAWFTGDFSHVTLPESATLKKNMTAAVRETLDSYISAASTRNLFLTPFTIGCRIRLFDGSFITPGESLLITPAEEPLRLAITGYNLYEKSLHTAVSFSRSPARLLLTLPAPSNAEDFLDILTAVEVYICAPASLYPAEFSVSGIRSVSIGGVRERVWYYSANDTETMQTAVSADRNHRLIASIPFSDIAAGRYASATALPIDAGALAKFTSLPKLSAPAASSTGGFTGTDGWRPYLHIQTPPLDLSMPDSPKSVTDLYLRGIFQRDQVEITLYGSLHREHWRILARSHGPYIRGLRRTPYPWHRVEIRLPLRRDDFIDALTFRFLKN